MFGFTDSSSLTNSLLTTISGAALLSNTLLNSIDLKLDALASIGGKLDRISDQLNSIYARQEHLKIDSYVDVRLLDSAGLFTAPCSKLTGLLVSAYAEGAPIPVNITDSTAVLTTNARTYLMDAITGDFAAAGGITFQGQYRNAGAVTDTLPFCAQITGVSGVAETSPPRWQVGSSIVLSDTFGLVVKEGT